MAEVRQPSRSRLWLGAFDEYLKTPVGVCDMLLTIGLGGLVLLGLLVALVVIFDF